jgi:DNA processing protein
MSNPSAAVSREWFALARAPGMHADHLRAAAASVPAESLPGRSPAQLRAMGLPRAAASWLAAPDWRQVEADRAWAQRSGTSLLTLDDPRYPLQLAFTPNAPLALWVRGDIEALTEAQVAIVGSRHATAGGCRNAALFAASLARSGLVITSGLALGIDGAAHAGALEAGGRSIAVCGTGLDVCYPARHAALARRLAESGAVISEFPPGTEPRAENFPRRNRIISGLSRAVLVVEAARDSGSLITARLAGDHGRPVLALPGSIHSNVSRGCHQLIRDGALLVETPAEVLVELKWGTEFTMENQQVESAPRGPVSARRLDKAGEMLLDALGFEPASVDDLIDRTGQRAPEISVKLMQLELEGLVEALPGGQYGRVPHPPIGK